MTEGDPTTSQIVWGKLHYDAVAGEHTNVVLPHPAAKVPKHLMTVFQLHLELRVWKRFKDCALNRDRIGILPTRTALGGCHSGLDAAASTLLLLTVLCLLNQT